MNYNKEKIYKILIKQTYSEKSSFLKSKYNTITLKVNIKANKIEIKKSIEKIFLVNVKKINTLIVKGKLKKNLKNSGYTKKWKKAYIILKSIKNLNIIDNI